MHGNDSVYWFCKENIGNGTSDILSFDSLGFASLEKKTQVFTSLIS